MLMTVENLAGETIVPPVVDCRIYLVILLIEATDKKLHFPV